MGLSHSVNQDAGGAWSAVASDGTPCSLLVVADGVSAGERSEEASRLAVAVVRERLASILAGGESDSTAVLQALCNAAREAHDEIAQQPTEVLSRADATTLVAAFCVGREAVGVWCGDTRVYRIGRAVERLTRDHSWAESVISQGLMSVEEAARDPRAHMITRWLGPPPREDPGIEAFRTELQDGDTLLCCSDGLYMYFNRPHGNEDELRELLIPDGLEDGLERLMATAVARGGHDDITVSALRVLGPAAPEASRAQ